MKRSPMPPRTSSLSRSTGVKPRKRKASEFNRIYGSKKRVEWVKSLPCVGCGRIGASDNAHTENGGMARKADYTTIIPLCTVLGAMSCHTMYHLVGKRMFEKMYKVDLRAESARIAAAWLLQEEGTA